LTAADYLCPPHDHRNSRRPVCRPSRATGFGRTRTIDSFLVSLAEERGEHAIGVILQGTGGDGTLGVAT